MIAADPTDVRRLAELDADVAEFIERRRVVLAEIRERRRELVALAKAIEERQGEIAAIAERMGI